MDFTKTAKSPILLKQENTKYALDPEKEMMGYIKLEHDEEKGLIIVIMDNVKFFPDGEYVYKLIFAGMKNEKRCYHMAGNISLSAHGKGEGSFRINPGDMDGKGSALWDFSTAIIAAMSTVNSREALHPVLSGDFHLEVPHDHNKRSLKDYSSFYNRFVLENCIAIAKAQEKYDDIFPFSHDRTGANWKKITDTSRFPIISPGSMNSVKKYCHFLFGWQDSHYFIGVPGRFFPEEQPDSGRSGFVFWQPITGMEEETCNKTVSIEERRKNIYGYWIAAINRYNGHIEEIPLIGD